MTGQADRVLLCLPHAGGTAGFFRTLPTAVSGSYRMLAVQYPGRQDRHREAAIGDVRLLASAIAEQIVDAGIESLDVLGHSFGGLVGFEVVRLLGEQASINVGQLTVTHSRPPSAELPDNPLHTLGDDAFIERIVALGGTDESVFADPDLRSFYLPPLRSDYAAVEQYQAPQSASVMCDITAIGGLRDSLVPAASAERWRRHTSGSFRIRVFDTDHFGIYQRPTELAGLIRRKVTAK
ncbi:MAG: thioesterase [Rhodococcus sp.]|nr:thioesterase [Rhodococcus sp. (in: high G+C Gram-positive bacteria)]